MKYTFFHKSHRAQTIEAAPRWTELEFQIGGKPRRKFYCDADGILESTLYLPVTFHTPKGRTGTLRVRLVRQATGSEPMDPTGYDERTLTPDSDDAARVRFQYLGEAEKGRVYYWQAQVLGPVAATATGTHYAQFIRR